MLSTVASSGDGGGGGPVPDEVKLEVPYFTGSGSRSNIWWSSRKAVTRPCPGWLITQDDDD